MATKPTVKNVEMTADRAQKAVNAIYHNASEQYQRSVPQIGTPDGNITDNSLATLRRIGNALIDYAPLRNEFISALYNRIGRVIVTSKTYDNPWAFFKRGILEYGETIEEIFIGLSRPHKYDMEKAAETVFKRDNPDVYSAFHSMNYQYFYKNTTSTAQLRQAFLSWEGVSDFTMKMVESLYTSANYDEYQVMKYLLASSILKGFLKPVDIGEVTTPNLNQIASTIRGAGSSLTFLSTENNLAGVPNYTNFDDQYLIIDTQFEAIFDVEVLANAFNMDKANFLARRVLVDGFNRFDDDRLQLLFGDNPNYRPFTEEEKQLLGTVPAVLVDKSFFMIYDNLIEFTEIQNPDGLYLNQDYHVWKTFSTSPFANALVFTPTAPAVTAITVSPTAVTIAPGQVFNLTVDVQTTGFASKAYTLSVDQAAESAGVHVKGSAIFTDQGATAGEYTVTVTADADQTKTGTVTVTVS